MNCPKCGNVLPQGAAFCPVCNEPLSAYARPTYAQTAYQATYDPAAYAAQQAGYQQQPYPQQPAYGQQQVYQQTYAQYGQNNYPTGYTQPYVYGQQSAREGTPLITALSGLPRAFLDSFTKPGEVLRGLMERRDLLTGPIVTVLVILLTFLAGMVVVRGVIGALMGGVAALSGVSLAGDSAAMSQGVSYIAGRIAPAVGGIAALCQLLSVVITTAVFLLYLCVMCKVRFTLELALGFAAVTTLPTAAAALACMVLSLLSPWLAVGLMLCGMAVSYVQACSLLPLLSGKTDAQLLPAKMLCVAISVAVVLLLHTLVGGALMGGVMQRVVALLSGVGSLI